MAEPQPASEATAAASPTPDTSPHSVPVGLNEAALDSPTFRATAAYFAEQIEAVEKWLQGYVSSTSKLAHDVQALEETVNNYLSKTMPSASDGIIDNDYTFLALKRVGDGAREYWQQMLSGAKRMDHAIVEPVRAFLSSEMRSFKDVRRTLDQSQKSYDSALARFVGQSKTKEPSALREDAFAVYEARKTYITASMDYCQLAPQVLLTVDKLLVKVSSEMWKEMRRSRDATLNATRWNTEMDRIRGWAKEMEGSESMLRRELQLMRREICDAALEEWRPSRELEDYSWSTVPFLGSRGPINLGAKPGEPVVSEKQGWLFHRIVTGKPVRHSWVRRWYYIRDGVFGWLTAASHGVLQGDEIGVLLCNARPAVNEDRRFCFEVKTKQQNLMLQAETQQEITEWLEVFEASKKAAFETSMNPNTTNLRTTGTDPAFAISPPSMPEFSAKHLDTQLGAEDVSPSVERAATLTIPSEGASPARQSFDPNGSLGRRSIATRGRDLAREQGESKREHAARIIQGLDPHRKSALKGESGVGTSSSSPHGIASLISASHNLLPAYPASILSPAYQRQTPAMLPTLESNPRSLAPMTLAKPPAVTQLSRAALLNSGEKGTGTDKRKLPPPIMANYWGSSVWAKVDVREEPMLPRQDDDDPIGIVVSEGTKTPLSNTTTGTKLDELFPPNYPPELKAQHQQFRLLFPNSPKEEKLVLVVRAMWASSSNDGAGKRRLAADGRIFITPDNMYFYGQQLGLVTAFIISLDIISEMTAATGRDAEQIILHLGQDTNDTGYSKITIKLFLDDLALLHNRLNLLVDNLQAEEPMETSEIIAALQVAEKDEFDKASPSAESWEEVSANTPVDDGTASGKPVRRYPTELSPGIGGGHRARAGMPPKLHLPAHPVVYEPDDMHQGVCTERHFEISAKACFHVLFGDKSFVFPKLYFERRAQQIAQGPWLLVDQGRMQRDFKFIVDHVNLLGKSKATEVHDSQVIDVYSDHITYVVTHEKTAWHLPHSDKFRIITKIVITHVAKSKCRLAVYVRIDWSKTPALSKGLIQRQALHDAESDAEELAELATDQIRKLGARSRTNRAIQVYGHVGQQTQVIMFSPAAQSSKKKEAIKPRTLTAMVFETVRSIAESAVTSLLMWAFAGLRSLFKVATAHRLLLLILGVSALLNLFLTSQETSAWWGERRAVSFMKRVGVTPNAQTSKAVYISDLAEAAGDVFGQHLQFPANSTCYGTFKDLLDTTDLDGPWEDAGSMLSSSRSRSTERRLRRTRQRLGSYRHDLLVAMRVVNSIERDVIYSEWENWLVNEKQLCDDLEQLLAGGSDEKELRKGAKQHQDATGQMSEEKRRALEGWRDNHCGSCKVDYQALLEGRKS